jgi:hypothetical protein
VAPNPNEVRRDQVGRRRIQTGRGAVAGGAGGARGAAASAGRELAEAGPAPARTPLIYTAQLTAADVRLHVSLKSSDGAEPTNAGSRARPRMVARGARRWIRGSVGATAGLHGEDGARHTVGGAGAMGSRRFARGPRR